VNRPEPDGGHRHDRPPLPRTNTYVLTPDGIRAAIFYTKVHDRLLRPLFADTHPPPELRHALHVINEHIWEFDEQIVPALRAAFPDDPDIEQRAALVLSHTLGVVYCRYLLGLEPLTSMSTDTLAAALGDAIQDHLTRPLSS
jgi:hypothetical protein